MRRVFLDPSHPNGDGIYALINQEGHHAFSIEHDGVVVMCHSEIQDHCQAARGHSSVADHRRGRSSAMLTASECLVRAIDLDTAQGPERCREVFVLLADGWRTVARVALWQDEFENNGIEIVRS